MLFLPFTWLLGSAFRLHHSAALTRATTVRRLLQVRIGVYSIFFASQLQLPPFDEQLHLLLH